MNKVILIGNVGRDPEVRRTQNGTMVSNFSLATSERWKDRNSGENRERTEWHNVVCFNEKLTEVIETYVRKGQKLCVVGQLQTRKWQDQSGQDRYTTEVVLNAFKGELELLDRGGNGGERNSQAQPQQGEPKEPAELDDEIPF